jgi:hypothetical protein
LNQPFDLPQNVPLAIRFADGDDSNVVIGYRWKGLARDDVERIEDDIRALEEEFDRCVDGEFAGRLERQHAQRLRRGWPG